MNSFPDQPSDNSRRNGRVLLAAIACLGMTLAVLILLRAASPAKVDGMVRPLVIIAALAFNLISFAARWLLTKSRRRIYLRGRLPLAFGLARLAAFFGCVTLILALIAALIAGPPFSEVAFDAFIVGLVYFAVLSLIAGGLLNVIIVARHFRGTLAATSREVSGRLASRGVPD
jgi:hypothetical protein